MPPDELYWHPSCCSGLRHCFRSPGLPAQGDEGILREGPSASVHRTASHESFLPSAPRTLCSGHLWAIWVRNSVFQCLSLFPARSPMQGTSPTEVGWHNKASCLESSLNPQDPRRLFLSCPARTLCSLLAQPAARCWPAVCLVLNSLGPSAPNWAAAPAQLCIRGRLLGTVTFCEAAGDTPTAGSFSSSGSQVWEFTGVRDTYGFLLPPSACAPPGQGTFWSSLGVVQSGLSLAGDPTHCILPVSGKSGRASVCPRGTGQAVPSPHSPSQVHRASIQISCSQKGLPLALTLP